MEKVAVYEPCRTLESKTQQNFAAICFSGIDPDSKHSFVHIAQPPAPFVQ
ncbi:MAG: hypothetical protein LM514_04485 [Streptococcus sp.]|nr:hypothetical protein [Streptococcus sp.]